MSRFIETGVKLSVRGSGQFQENIRQSATFAASQFNQMRGAISAGASEIAAIGEEAVAAASGMRGMVGAGFMLGRSLTSVASAAATGVGLTAAFTAAQEVARGAVKEFNALYESSARLNVSLGDLQEIQGVALLGVGASASQAEQAFSAFNTRVQDAARGTEAASATFRRLGVSVRDASDELRDQKDILLDVADGLKNLGDDTAQETARKELFGGAQGAATFAALDDGREKINAMIAEARELGLVVDDVLIEKARDVSREMAVASRAIDLQLKQAFVDLAPTLLATAQHLGTVANGVRSFRDAIVEVDERTDQGLAETLDAAFERRNQALRQTLSGMRRVMAREIPGLELRERIDGGDPILNVVRPDRTRVGRSAQDMMAGLPPPSAREGVNEYWERTAGLVERAKDALDEFNEIQRQVNAYMAGETDALPVDLASDSMLADTLSEITDIQAEIQARADEGGPVKLDVELNNAAVEKMIRQLEIQLLALEDPLQGRLEAAQTRIPAGAAPGDRQKILDLTTQLYETQQRLKTEAEEEAAARRDAAAATREQEAQERARLQIVEQITAKRTAVNAARRGVADPAGLDAATSLEDLKDIEARLSAAARAAQTAAETAAELDAARAKLLAAQEDQTALTPDSQAALATLRQTLQTVEETRAASRAWGAAVAERTEALREEESTRKRLLSLEQKSADAEARKQAAAAALTAPDAAAALEQLQRDIHALDQKASVLSAVGDLTGDAAERARAFADAEARAAAEVDKATEALRKRAQVEEQLRRIRVEDRRAGAARDFDRLRAADTAEELQAIQRDAADAQRLAQIEDRARESRRALEAAGAGADAFAVLDASVESRREALREEQRYNDLLAERTQAIAKQAEAARALESAQQKLHQFQEANQAAGAGGRARDLGELRAAETREALDALRADIAFKAERFRIQREARDLRAELEAAGASQLKLAMVDEAKRGQLRELRAERAYNDVLAEQTQRIADAEGELRELERTRSRVADLAARAERGMEVSEGRDRDALGAAQSKAALDALERKERLRDEEAKVLAERDRLAAELEANGGTPADLQALDAVIRDTRAAAAAEREWADAVAARRQGVSEAEAEQARLRQWGEQVAVRYRTAQEQVAAAQEKLNDAYAAGVINQEIYDRAMSDVEGDLKRLNDAAARAGSSMESMFEDVIFSAGNAGDALRNFGLEMAKLTFQETAGASLTKFVRSASTDLMSDFASIGVNKVQANGGAFVSGVEVTPFAMGGVVGRATLFGHAGGLGVMGEAGPEAIMPLKRGADGRLGVASAQSSPTVNVYVQTRDPGTKVSVRPSAQQTSGGVAAVASRAANFR